MSLENNKEQTHFYYLICCFHPSSFFIFTITSNTFLYHIIKIKKKLTSSPCVFTFVTIFRYKRANSNPITRTTNAFFPLKCSYTL